MDLQHDNIPAKSCILSQTDSSSAAGWLRKSHFSDGDDEIIQMTMTRHLASLVMQANCCLYSKWFAGDENTIAYSLSYDFHLLNETLTKLIASSIPSQVPFGLKISTAARNHFLADLSAAKYAIKNRVVKGTNLKQTHNWERYKYYLTSIGIANNIYLDSFSNSKKHQRLSTFAQAIHFSTRSTTNPKSESVQASLDSMAQAFRLANR